MAFDGFKPGALAFLRELSANNTREWFAQNQDRYESELREPAEGFILALGPVLACEYPSVAFDTRRNGSGSLMRIHRDLRFSRDKRPYKDNLGVIFPLLPGKKVEAPMFYFHIDGTRAFFYGGQHVFPPETLERYRLAVDDGRTGPALQAIIGQLEGEGLRAMEEPAYKRVPHGYAQDHPRAGLLMQSALGVGMDLDSADLERPDLVDRCMDAAVRMRPLIDWLMPLNG